MTISEITIRQRCLEAISHLGLSDKNGAAMTRESLKEATNHLRINQNKGR